jgi:hypothetical protein
MKAKVSERFVAFLDVLGFSAQVRAQTQAELTATYKRLLAATYVNTTLTVTPDDHRKWQAEAHFEPWEERQSRYVHVMMASDSIVLFSDGTAPDEAGSVIGSTYRLLRASFRLGMPLRGAIVLGELDVVEAEDIAEPSDWIAHVGGLVGLGLVEAHDLERSLEWAGVIVDGPAAWGLAKHLREHVKGDPDAEAAVSPGMNPFLTEAFPPFKRSGESARAWVIDWTFGIDDGQPSLTREQVGAAFRSYGRTLSNQRARKKRDNTLRFWDEMSDTLQPGDAA